MFKRIFSLAAAAVSSFFSGSKVTSDASILRGYRSRRDAPRRVRIRMGTSKYRPHQGARECERRRIGGFYTLRRVAK